jgi:hypothetical protein
MRTHPLSWPGLNDPCLGGFSPGRSITDFSENKYLNQIKIKSKEDSSMRKKTFTRNVGVLLTDELYQRIVSITDKQEITLSEFVRGSLLDILKKLDKEEQRHD